MAWPATAASRFFLLKVCYFVYVSLTRYFSSHSSTERANQMPRHALPWAFMFRRNHCARRMLQKLSRWVNLLNSFAITGHLSKMQTFVRVGGKGPSWSERRLDKFFSFQVNFPSATPHWWLTVATTVTSKRTRSGTWQEPSGIPICLLLDSIDVHCALVYRMPL